MRTAFITGASRNIGRAFANRLAAEGYAVAINSRSPEAVEEVVQEITSNGGKAVGCPADVTDREAIFAAIDKAEAELGPVDILFNNAVLRAHGYVDELTVDSWNQVLAVTLTGAFNCTARVMPGMKERGWGRVINMAGVSGQRGNATGSPVVTAKAGLVGFTKAVALEAAPHGVTVNALAPGLIGTEHRLGLGDDEAERDFYDNFAKKAEKLPIGRLGKIEEVVHGAMYLCSDEAGFVTGQTLNISGGGYM